MPTPSPKMRPPEPLTQRQTIIELRKIRAILEPNSRKSWYEKLYAKIITFAKYVGIPGVIIAAIGPTQKLVADLIEYQNKALIQRVYLDYASTLLAEGSIDRANKLLTTLENQKDFDARLQYYKSKVLIAMAIQQARNYTEAFDTASILSEIAEKKPLYFPSLGTAEDLMELNFALVDIDIAQQNYSEARNKMNRMSEKREFVRNRTFASNIEYRMGSLDVLQNDIAEGQHHLLTARDLGEKAGQKLLIANATFQLAKTYRGNGPTALSYYKEAAAGYASLSDKFGLLKTYNDMAEVYFDDRNYTEARNYSNKAQVVATEVSDDLGYARATVTLAAIEKMEHNYSGSIRLSLEALGVFKQQGNLFGILNSANILANNYEAIGDYADALAYAKQDFDASLERIDPRQVSASCGTLSNIYADTGDRSEMAFASLCAATLIKQLRMDTLPDSAKEYDVFQTRLREVVAENEESATLIKSIEKRVQDIFLKLNFRLDVIRNEINSLQVSTSSAGRQAPRMPGLAQIEFEVKRRILCELRSAVADVNHDFPISEGPAPDRLKPVARYIIPLDWIAAMSLSFELDEFSGLNSDGASPSSVKISGPGTSRSVTAPQSRMLGFGGPLSSTATRIDKFDSSYTISYLMVPEGPNSFCHPENDPLARVGLKANLSFSPFNIEGTLGIKDWLVGAMISGALTGIGSVGGQVEAVSHEIKFVIVSNGNITPTWKIVSVPNTSGAFLSAGRTRTHDLIITIGPNDSRTLNSHLASQIGQATGSSANGTRLMPQQ